MTNVRALLGVLVALVAACSAEPRSSDSVDCASDRDIAGACAGLHTVECEGDACVAGLSCATTAKAATDAELTSALASASAGACVLLTGTTYADANVPEGVKLVGRGADAVHVGKITVGGGALVRGLASSGGIEIAPGAETRVEDVRVTGSAGDGVRVQAGATARITTSEILGSALQGIRAVDAASVTVEETLIDGSKGAGLWLQCTGGCSCASEVRASLSHVLVQKNEVAGIALVGVHAKLDGVDVRDHGIGANFRAAGGLSASQCSTVEATRMRVLDSASYGVLVDNSTATFGSSDPSQGVEVARNQFGVWVQNTDPSDGQPFVLENANVHDNSGVGVGIGPKSGSVVVRSSQIATTHAVTVPVLADGIPAAREVGDGVSWGEGAHVRIEAVKVRASARASILVDGVAAPNSAILQTALLDGDETKGVIFQRTPDTAPLPTTDGQLPAPQRNAKEVFAVATPPQLPAPQ